MPPKTKVLERAGSGGLNVKLLGSIENRDRKGELLFTSEIMEDEDGRVFFTADADIDADGANGQNEKPAAYRVGDQGSDHLANAGLGMNGGKVVCKSDAARDIVILGADNEPRVFAGDIIASKTWYRIPDVPVDDPAAYLDAETVPYVVVPPLIVKETAGIVRGCRARVTWNGGSVECVVGDKGPSKKTGEISIAAARALGMGASPRHGGVSAPEVLYEIWPGVAATGFVLQGSHG